MSGAIPAELGHLTNLAELSLDGNELSGAIPAELGNLDNLTGLHLSGNQLSGSIPAELGDLTNLRQLNLSGNELNGSIPAELGNLSNLTGLHLSGNELSGAIPAELGDLASLTELSLDGNKLSGTIPAELGDLANLAELHLRGNKLNGAIPAELGGLGNLKRLSLEGNGLSLQIPQTLRSLRQLRRLSLDESLPLRDLSTRQRRLVERSNANSDDQIAALIAAGETKTFELKSTLRVNLHTGERDKRIEHEVLKNIAAFLNTDGGTLVIGVDDNKKPLGLDNDRFLDEDQMLDEDKMGRHLSNLVSAQIGASAWGNIDPEFSSYQGKRILVIRCTKSDTPVHVGKDDEFYIRTGPQVEQLTTRGYKNYVDKRFR